MGGYMEPIEILRVNRDLYYVGRVRLIRRRNNTWDAVSTDSRTMFSSPSLEGILEMAHGACEMMRPA